MTTPCEQSKRIEKMENTQIEHDRMLIRMDENLIHIKERLDNGISTTVTKTWEKLCKDIGPAVEDNSWWVAKLKTSVWAIAISFVCMLLMGTAAAVLRAWVMKGA